MGGSLVGATDSLLIYFISCSNHLNITNSAWAQKLVVDRVLFTQGELQVFYWKIC